MSIKKLCVYIADFTYFLPDDTYIIADAKSERTLKDPVFRLKAKMVLNEIGSNILLLIKPKTKTISDEELALNCMEIILRDGLLKAKNPSEK